MVATTIMPIRPVPRRVSPAVPDSDMWWVLLRVSHHHRVVGALASDVYRACALVDSERDDERIMYVPAFDAASMVHIARLRWRQHSSSSSSPSSPQPPPLLNMTSSSTLSSMTVSATEVPFRWREDVELNDCMDDTVGERPPTPCLFCGQSLRERCAVVLKDGNDDRHENDSHHQQLHVACAMFLHAMGFRDCPCSIHATRRGRV